MSSIVVNFSTASDIEAEYDEEEQRLSIEITEGEPAEEIGEEAEPEETEEVGEEEEEEAEDDEDDNDNGNNNGNNGNGNGNGNGNDAPGVRIPELPGIDLNMPGGFFD